MKKPVKFAIIADPHYYSEKLGVTGRAYELRNESDQKVLAQTGAVVSAAFDELIKTDIEFILIAGDVTNNGETVSHEEFRELMYEYKKHKPIYVITSTHDWCSDRNPRRYEGDRVYNDVPCLKLEELRNFYADFGPNEAISEYFTPAGNSSYAVRIDEALTVLCLNDDYDETRDGYSGFSDEHLAWISAECNAAYDRGDNCIAMMHHHFMVTPIDKIANGSGSVKYRNELAGRIADSGLTAVFVGHSHMQHITKVSSENGNPLYEINVGSICGYPAPMVYCTVENDELSLKSDFLKGFTYNGKQYGAEYLEAHATNLITKVVKAAADNQGEEFAALVAAVGMARETALKKFKYIKPVLKKLNTAKVGGTAKLLNTLTFGKAIDRNAAKEIEDIRVLDLLLESLLNILDGGLKSKPEDSAQYKVISSTLSLPLRTVKALKIKNGGLIRTLTNVSAAAKQVVCGGEINANNAVIPLKRK